MSRLNKNKREQLEELLRELACIGDVKGTAIVARDGLLIADALSKDIDTEIFASMTATMHGAGETAIQELKLGDCQLTMAESEKSIVVAMGVNTVFLVVAVANKTVNLGLLRLEIKRTADSIMKLLE